MEQNDSCCEQAQLPKDKTSFYPMTMNSTKQKPRLKLNLKVIEESEENPNTITNTDEEDCLGYASNYILNTENKNSKNNKNNLKSFTRKFSNVSTSFSENFQELTGFTPKKKSFNNTENNISNFIFFGRERLNSTPLNDYFNGTDGYFRELNPEKNDYQKSHNYIEKDKYFTQYFSSSKKINGFRSFDLTEENKLFQSQQHPITPKNSMDILCNFQQTENNISNYINTEPNKNNFQNNKNVMPINHKINNMNLINMGGKFDIPMCCFGYFTVDCK